MASFLGKCRYCGATGRTVAGLLNGTPFKSPFSLKRHEMVCRQNPNRTTYHKRQRAVSSPNSTLKVISDLPGGGLLCVDTHGRFYNALRVRINVLSDKEAGRE